MGDIYVPLSVNATTPVDTAVLANWFDSTTNSMATHLPGVTDTVAIVASQILVGGLNIAEMDIGVGSDVVLAGTGAFYSFGTVTDQAARLSLQDSTMWANQVALYNTARLDVSQGGTMAGPANQPVAATIGDLIMGPARPLHSVNSVNLGDRNIGIATLENANEGSGNTYDPAAEITGTGTLIQYPGADPFSQISVDHLDFGTLHVGDVVDRSLTVIDGQGDFGGTQMRGWFENGAITDPQLSGFATPNNGTSGQTPPLPATALPTAFAIGGRGGSATEAIRFTASHTGSLSGQSATIASQFGGLATTPSAGFNQSATIPITGTVNNYAVPSFALDAAPAGTTSWQTADGTTVTYLGWTPQNQALGSVALGVANTATGPSDLLAGLTVDNQDGSFAAINNGKVFNLGAGQQQATETLTMDTSQPGWHWDAVQMHSVAYNGSGYAALQPVATDILVFYVQGH